MKKFINIMLALALTTGVATITLAQDGKDSKATTAKKKGGKKGKSDTTAKDTTKTGKAGKTKGKKGTDAPATK